MDLISIIQKEDNKENLKKILTEASSQYPSLKLARQDYLNYSLLAGLVVEREQRTYLQAPFFTVSEYRKIILTTDIFPQVISFLEDAIILSEAELIDRFYYKIKTSPSLLSPFIGFINTKTPIFPCVAVVMFGVPYVSLFTAIGVPLSYSIPTLVLSALFPTISLYIINNRKFESVKAYYKKADILQTKINEAFFL